MVEIRSLILNCKVALFAALVLLASCASPSRNREPLNKFATVYVEARDFLFLTHMLSWAVELNLGVEESNNLTEYRTLYENAIDSKLDANTRTNAARQAVEVFETKSKSALDECWRNNGFLDEKSLALVEVAHAISDERFRGQAIKVANLVRDAEQVMSRLAGTYEKVSELQLALLNAIVKKNGDLNSSFSQMSGKLQDYRKSLAEASNLIEQERTLTRTIKEQYAAFKGMTGVELDYVESTTGDGNKAP